MKDFWPGDGCGFGQFVRHRKDKRARARRRLLREFADREVLPGDAKVWPFVHNCVKVEGIEQPLDPLAVPLVATLRMIQGVTTVSCCQGHADGAAYASFLAEMPAAMEVMRVIGVYEYDQRNSLFYWDAPVMTLEGQHDGRPLWLVQFYDTLALMRFNAEACRVPLNVQMHGIPDGVQHKEKFEVLADIASFEAVIAGKIPRGKRT